MTERKNVLLLVHTFGDPGGTQRLLHDLGVLLSERHNVFECSFDAFREPRVFENGNPVLSLETPPPRGSIERLVGYAKKAIRLNRLKRRHAIDVTISNLWPADFVNAIAGGPGRRVSLGLVNVVGNRQNSPMLRWRRLVSWIYQRFDMTVSINAQLTAELSGLFSLSPEKTLTIPAFVDLPDIDRIDTAHVGSRPRIAWFGRLHKMKNLAPLLHLLPAIRRRVPGTQLIAIGEGPAHDELVREAVSAGSTVSDGPNDLTADVVFTGFVPDPYRFLKGCDLFALTSRSEGFGLVMVEAMCAGLPVIASDCPTGGAHLIVGGSEPFRHGRDRIERTPFGALLPIPELDDATSLTMWEDAIVDLLTDGPLRAQQSVACRQRAEEFSKARVRDQWLAVVDAS